jgi:hypothetical protein
MNKQMQVAVSMARPPKNQGVGFILKNKEYKEVTGMSRFYKFALRGNMAHFVDFNVAMALKRKYGDILKVTNPKTGDEIGESTAFDGFTYQELKKELSKYQDIADERLPYVGKKEVIIAKLVELRNKYGEM